METFVLVEEARQKRSNGDWVRGLWGSLMFAFFFFPRNWHKENLGKNFKLFDCEV